MRADARPLEAAASNVPEAVAPPLVSDGVSAALPRAADFRPAVPAGVQQAASVLSRSPDAAPRLRAPSLDEVAPAAARTVAAGSAAAGSAASAVPRTVAAGSAASAVPTRRIWPAPAAAVAAPVISLMDDSDSAAPGVEAGRMEPGAAGRVHSLRNLIPTAKRLMSKREMETLPVPPLPRVVVVKEVGDLAPAFAVLSACNVLSIGVRAACAKAVLHNADGRGTPTGERNLGVTELIFVDGEVRVRPEILVIAGARLRDQYPLPAAICIDVVDEQVPDEVYVFNLPALLPAHGAALDAGLAPLLADPAKLILGVGIRQDLRALARSYYASVPCLQLPVRGVRDIGAQCNRNRGVLEPASMKACRANLRLLVAHFSGFKLYPGPLGLVSNIHAANEVQGVLMVYVSAGAFALDPTPSGAETLVDMGVVDVWGCRTCGNLSLDYWEPVMCTTACKQSWEAVHASDNWLEKPLEARLRKCVIGVSEPELRTLELQVLKRMMDKIKMRKTAALQSQRAKERKKAKTAKKAKEAKKVEKAKKVIAKGKKKKAKKNSSGKAKTAVKTEVKTAVKTEVKIEVGLA